MNRLLKIALSVNLLLLSALPALAHSGHGFDNPVLHRIQHLLGGMDPAWAAVVAGILGLALVIVLYARSQRRANRS